MVKFYIRAREPMDTEVSEALDAFAAEYGCDRSGAARHLILLGKRYRSEIDRQVVMDQLSLPKVPSLEPSSAIARGQWEGKSIIATSCEVNVTGGTAAQAQSPSSLPVTQVHRGTQSPCQLAQPTERPGDSQPVQEPSPQETPPKRLDMTKLRFRS